MVGPGTGIAPMRALLQERAAQGNAEVGVKTRSKKNAASSESSGENILFFGCKSPDQDYIYKYDIYYICHRYRFMTNYLF